MSQVNTVEAEAIEINFQDIYQKVLKHRLLVVATVACSIIFALIYAFSQVRIYQSTGRIMVDSQPPKIFKVDNTVMPDYTDRPNFFNSQIEVLKSRSVADLVFQDLGGYEPIKRRGKPESKLKPITEVQRKDALLKQVKISPVRMTQIIAISVEDSDPKLAARIANSWIRSYIFFSSMDQLFQRRSELESDLTQQLEFYKRKHPIIVGLRSQIASIDQKIENERRRLDKESGSTVSSVSPSGDITNVKVLDKAEVPIKPIRPNKALYMLIAIVFGVFAGFALVFLIESIDQTVKTGVDLQQLLQLSCLATIPFYKAAAQDNGFLPAHIASKEPYSGVAEAFRCLRTGIVFSDPDSPKRTFVITSSTPGEGKSTIAVNLATVFAMSNERTVLIGADMRKPVLHRFFDVEPGRGVADLLALGMDDLDKVVHKTDIPGLDILFCGNIPPNPAELVGSQKLEQLLKKLLTRYDRVIFDSPPLLAATDAVILSTKVDTTILVARSRFTQRQAILRSKQSLDQVKAKILGVVINAVKSDSLGTDVYNYYYETDRKKTTSQKKLRDMIKFWSENFFFAGLALAPLLYGSVSFQSQAVLAGLFLASFYLIFFVRPVAVNPVLKTPFTVLGCAMLLFALFQLLPLPSAMVEFFSPAAHKIVSRFMPGPHPELLPLSVYPSDTVRGILQCMLYAVVFLTTRMLLFYDGRKKNDWGDWNPENYKYLNLACLVAVLSLLFHSLYDFNLHIASNGIYFAFLLALASGVSEKTYDREFFRKAVRFVFVFGFTIAAFALVQKLFYNGKIYWAGMPAPQPMGPFYNYDHYAGFMQLCTAIAIGMLATTTGTAFIPRFVMVTLMVSTIFLSTSRGGIMSFVLSQIVFFFFIFRAVGRSRIGQTIAAVLALFLFTGVVVVWLGPQEFLNRFHLLSIQNILGMEGPINPRLLFYQDTLQVVKDFPFFGTGFNTFATNFSQYRTFDYTPNFLRYTHNDYLQLLSEMGVVGLVFLGMFLALFVSYIKRAVKMLK